MQAREPSEGYTHAIYGDLNCPFCYVMCHRIAELGGEARVEWRGVDHMPELAAPGAVVSEDEQAALDAELARIRELNCEVKVARPPARPSTSLALRWLNAVERAAPHLTEELLRNFFNAIWVERRDLATESVVRDVVVDTGITNVEPSPEDVSTVARHTEEWRRGPYSGRIPSMIAASGSTLLGLAPRPRVTTFLRSGLFSSATDDSC